MNSITRTPIRVRHPTKLRLADVVRVEQASPRMRRIMFGGEALEGFTSAAADDHVKLFFPTPGETTPHLPGGIAGETERPAQVMRDFTPRRFDAAARELTIEFVLHGDGPATAWAAQAAPGDMLGIAGPRGSFLLPDDFDAYVLMGDETALPAIARRLEELRPGVTAIVLIEVADRDEERHLPTAANAAITFLHRNGAAPGTTALLHDAVQCMTMPRGDVHAWIAAEIDTARALRTHFMQVRGLPRDHVRAAGYWRIGEADSHARIED
jgi:NADPH-dependent ferric siderophore reductase